MCYTCLILVLPKPYNMLIRLLPLLALLLLSVSTFAQNEKVTVKRETKTTKGNTTETIFTATNESFARQTIIMELNGGKYRRPAVSLPVVATLKPGNNSLLRLSDVNGAPGYGYTYAQGCLNTKPAAVTYLLPVAPGKNTRIDTLSNIETTYFGKQRPENWHAYAMEAAQGDTIFASRRGLVIEVESREASGFTSGISYTSSRTHLTLEHEDCTRARYELFEQEGVLTEPGQWVEAGDPLGRVSDGKAYVNGTHLRFSVYYPNLTRETLKELRKDGNYRYTNTYVSPVFASIGVPQSGETYLSEHPEGLIFQEMSKRQVKKWKKKREQ